MNSTDEQLAELLTLTCEVDKYGTIRYRNSAGQVHRTHGPAIVWQDGTKCWYLDGKLHRSDGPAIVYQNAVESWYLNGTFLSKEQWAQHMRCKRD